MKKIFLAGLCAALCAVGLLWWHHSQTAQIVASRAVAQLAVSAVSGTNAPPAAAQAVVTQSLSRELNLAVNPYAAGLRAPGKSKREWDADYIKNFQSAKTGDPVKFELTGGVMAEGVVKILQVAGSEVSYVSGELTAPEAGKFFFLTPPVGGKAGKAVGVVEFPASKTAYRIEPTGPNGEPELWQRRLDEVICVEMVPAAPAAVKSAAQAATNETENIVPLRPDQVPDYIPSYNANIVSLQSYPGSPAVLLLDFAGGYTASWGGVTYSRAPVSNATIKDIWKRVAEDFMPFNINVTTDIKVFQAAPAASRQRCCLGPNPVTGVGVAYIGSWNWGNDTVCWSGYYVGKPGAEVAAHEPGHTLGLGHQGQNPSTGYYGGQGSGETGWAPIMGVGYYQPLATWAKGEYTNANNTGDALVTITGNNNVHYRTDDTGDTLATSRYLEIYTNNTVFAEGVIEQTADTDAFQFTTTGGAVSLTVKPVGDWANLATLATLADATDTVIASNNVQNQVSSTITTNLPAGTYTFRVTGAGKNDPLIDGFSSYASLGYYSITGSVAGARQPTRLSVRDHATNNTVVGPVAAVNPNSSPLVFAIMAGNTGTTFSVDNSGVVSVANNALLDYYKLATNTALYAAQFEVFMNITNVNNPALTELNRRVVIAVQKFYPPMPVALTVTADTSLRIDLAWIGGQEAANYNVKRATTPGGPYTTVSSPTVTSYVDSGLTNGVTYYYVVSAVNTNGESANSSEASAVAQAVAGFGFETPSLGSGNYSYNPAGGFWTFNAQSGISGSGIVANGSGFLNPNASEGVQAAFVQSFGTITQTLSGFVPGTNYTITYSAAQRSGVDQHGGESWNVVIDNTVIKSNNIPGSTSYTTYTATFTASAATHTLAFVGTDLAGGDNTVFLDNVRFSPVLQPVAAAVTLTSPANNAAFDSSALISLTATVTTNGNTINGVQFYADNITLLGQITNAPYTFSWANVSAGIHTVFARVLFNNGSSADSTPINLAVINHNPDLGFETPSLGSGNYAYTPAGAAWTFTENYELRGSGIAANGSGFGNPNAPQGTQAALLQGYASISQTLTGFAPGTNYTITYSAAQRSGPDQHGGESWNVTIDGNAIKTNNPGSTSFTTFTATFTASAATHTLAFVGTDLAGGDNTVFIDNVSITPPRATIPTPNVTTDTLPVTAVDVVGSAVTFMAAFSSTNPITYQWQKITGSVTADISGATNTTLTLTNLQLSDAASYRLQAANVFGISVSTAQPLTVSSVPVAVNNVVTALAAQTGTGSGTFTPTWTVVTNNSLIAGKIPSSTSGNFTLEAPGRSVNALTAGGSLGITLINGTSGVTTSTNYVTCGNGSAAGATVTYTLTGSTSGYDLTNLMVYGGWASSGRDQQAYTVSYAKVSSPTAFISLGTVNYNPANLASAQSATRATLTAASGVLATNVAAVRFNFTIPASENGYCGYAAIDLFGVPTIVKATNPTNLTMQVAANILTLSWPGDHIGWRLQVQTNNLTQGLGTNWWDVVGSTTTNQIAIPLNTTDASVFYRLAY